MAKGTIKNVKPEGYGFIETQDSPLKTDGSGRHQDIFFHRSQVVGELASRGAQQGDKVTFDIKQGERGLSAANVKLDSAASEASTNAPTLTLIPKADSMFSQEDTEESDEQLAA